MCIFIILLKTLTNISEISTSQKYLLEKNWGRPCKVKYGIYVSNIQLLLKEIIVQTNCQTSFCYQYCALKI